MKRFFLSLTTFLALWIFSFVGFSVQAASGYTYPPHLNGDPNYTLAYGHMGVGTYVDTKAVKVLDQSNKGVVLQLELFLDWYLIEIMTGLFQLKILKNLYKYSYVFMMTPGI